MRGKARRARVTLVSTPDPNRDERDRNLVRLREAATAGGLTLAEYAERAAALERAGTPEEIAAAVADLCVSPHGDTHPPRTWLVGVLGGTEQRGRWRLGRRLSILAVFGGIKLDVGQAQLEAPDPVIAILAFFGGVEITAPPGVPIALSGISLLGGRSDERPVATQLTGAPPIRVRAYAVLGGVKIK